MERMVRIHQSLADGKFPNAKSLGRVFEVSAKTIQRDMEFMRDRLHLPIAYDGSKRGFYYTEAVSGFPTVQIAEGELLALLVARQAIASYRGTPYEHTLESAFAKLTASLTDQVSFEPAELPDSISFRAIGAAPVDPALYQTLSKAVLESEEITFRYQKLQTDRPESRRLQPYHLACVHGLWYLVGHDLDRRTWRTFAIPRISKIAGTGRHFRRDPGFTPQKYFGDSFGVLRGEGPVAVHIRFDAYAAALVRERFWHGSQVVTELAEGELEMELHLSHPDEVMRWVLSWGEHARILSPESLASRVRETAEKVTKAYQS